MPLESTPSPVSRDQPLLASGNAGRSESSADHSITASRGPAIAPGAGVLDQPAVTPAHAVGGSLLETKPNADLRRQIRQRLNPGDLSSLVRASHTLHEQFQPFLVEDKNLLEFVADARVVNTVPKLRQLLTGPLRRSQNWNPKHVASDLTPAQQRRPMLILASRPYKVPANARETYRNLLRGHVQTVGSSQDLSRVNAALQGGPQHAVLQLVSDGMSVPNALFACALDSPSTASEYLFAEDAHVRAANGPGKQAVSARDPDDAQMPAEKVADIVGRLGLNAEGRRILEAFSIDQYASHVLGVDPSIQNARTALGLSTDPPLEASTNRLTQALRRIEAAAASAATVQA